jgi:alanine-glyoxylate transaminase/serine-glyoxylate transaminase/serine-pyruvate transaminase
MSDPKLMIPGPVDVPDSVREAMAIPSRPHYGNEWICLYGETQEMAKQVFKTKNDLYLMAGPGTMALEAALGSALEPGAHVLVPSNGFFGERLVSLVESLALIPVRVDVKMGQPLLPPIVQRALNEHPEVEAMAVVHHETSTGVLNPLEGLAAAARERDLLVVVDAVSSLGGVPLLVDEWGIDCCVTVANKAFETPPGVALLSVSPRTWERINAREAHRGWYLDLRTWRWYAENWGDWHPTPVTMPTSNINALHHSLQCLLEEGLESRYAAYSAAAMAVQDGLRAMGFSMLTEAPYASPLTTAFQMRPGVKAGALQRSLLEDAGVMVSGGIGELKGKILRVGHIGQARRRDYVVAFLLGVESFLRAQGADVERGTSLVGLEGLTLA